MARLPDAQDLLDRFVSPHYSEEDLKRITVPTVWCDLVTKYKRNLDPFHISAFAAETQDSIRKQLDRMVEASRGDWGRNFKIRGEPSIDWLKAFHRHWTPRRILELIDESSSEEDGNDYMVVCIELGAVLGRVMTQSCPDLKWVFDLPYWESWLYHGPTGTRVSVFSWAVKRMSDTAYEDNIAEKAQAAIQGLSDGTFA